MTEDSMQNTSFSGSDSEDELMSAGKQNENLKISIANSEDPESGVVFLKLENYDVLDDSLDTVANVTVNVGNSVTLAKDGLNKVGNRRHSRYSDIILRYKYILEGSFLFHTF